MEGEFVNNGRPFVVTCGTSELSHNIDDYPEGIILPIDKPYRWTSADVIRKLKYAATKHFGRKNLKIGHAGTLDPLATGILIVCIGKATKLAQELMDHDKEYVAGINFGATTPSYDLEKEIDREFPYEHITEELLRERLAEFVGEQEQVAPLFSAKSIDGVRAYEHARKLYKRQGAEQGGGRSPVARVILPSEGENAFDKAAGELIRTARINIYEAELLGFRPAEANDESNVALDGGGDVPSGPGSRINVASPTRRLPHADIRLACGKGTYVRAFARDLGEALGSGAHLASLRRTASGPFTAAAAVPLDHALALFRPSSGDHEGEEAVQNPTPEKVKDTKI